MPARPADPHGVILRRAARVTVVGVPLFWLLGFALGRPAAAGPAVFAVFTLGSFADFAGRPSRRALRYLAAGGVAMLMFPLGALASRQPVVLVAVTGVVAFAGFFMGVLGGPFYGARFPVVIAFLFAATAPSGPGMLGDRMLGWAAGTVAAAVASVVLWPAHRRFPVRTLVARTCDLAARVMRAAADDGGADAESVRALRMTIDQMRSLSLEAHLHPGAVARDERLLAEMVHQAERVVSTMLTIPAVADPDEADVRLARAAADTLDDVARVMARPAGALTHDVDTADLLGCFDAHVERARERLAEAAGSERAGTVVEAVVSSAGRRAVARAVLVLAEMAGAWATGRGLEPATTMGDRSGDDPLATIASHLGLHSLWFRNAVRAAVALMVSMAIVAAGAGGDHAFWVTLGTFSVVRADLSTTRRSASATVVGTTIGFVLSSALVLVAQDVTWVLWALLPLTVFFASYSGALRPEVNAAAFTVFLVVLTTLVAPAGLHTGEARLVNVAMGAAVTFVVGAILWPRVGTVPAGALADIFGRCAACFRQAVAECVGGAGDGAAVLLDPSSVLAEATATDRVLDTLASSAPSALPPSVREHVVATTDAAVAVTLFLSGHGPLFGIAADPAIARIGDDAEAVAAVGADAAWTVGELDALVARLRGDGAARAGGRPDRVVGLAADRLRADPTGAGVDEVAALVRVGFSLDLLGDVAHGTAGVHLGA